VTAVPKDGENEISHLEKRVIVTPVGLQTREVSHIFVNPLLLSCHISVNMCVLGEEQKLLSGVDSDWRAEGEPYWATIARLRKV